MCALRNPSRYRSVSAFAPIAAPHAMPLGTEGASRNYLGSDNGTRGASTMPRELVARKRFPGPILIDQGTADQF